MSDNGRLLARAGQPRGANRSEESGVCHAFGPVKKAAAAAAAAMDSLCPLLAVCCNCRRRRSCRQVNLRPQTAAATTTTTTSQLISMIEKLKLWFVFVGRLSVQSSS